MRPKPGTQFIDHSLDGTELSLLSRYSDKGLPNGAICVHNDPQGHHPAILLGRHNGEQAALFLTTHPGWSRFSRKASLSECLLLGVRGKRTSYLAPVVRPQDEFYRHVTTISNQDLADYWAEFSRAFPLEFLLGASVLERE